MRNKYGKQSKCGSGTLNVNNIHGQEQTYVISEKVTMNNKTTVRYEKDSADLILEQLFFVIWLHSELPLM